MVGETKVRISQREKDGRVEERILIQKAKEGHQLSMNFLLEENYKPLYAFLVRMTGNPEVAKDMTQETMIKAVTNIKKFRGDSKFSSWLIRIGINTYKNYLKKNRIQVEPLDYSAVSEDNLEDKVERRDRLARLAKRLGKVKEPDRTIFVLKYYECYDYK